MAVDRMPHFTVTRLDGARAAYADIWQLRNLLLVLLPDEKSPAETAYLDKLNSHAAELRELTAETVVTRDDVAGLPRPGVVVADRWGEIHFVAAAAGASELTPPPELLEWIRYIDSKCPECEGEAR